MGDRRVGGRPGDIALRVDQTGDKAVFPCDVERLGVGVHVDAAETLDTLGQVDGIERAVHDDRRFHLREVADGGHRANVVDQGGERRQRLGALEVAAQLSEARVASVGQPHGLHPEDLDGIAADDVVELAVTDVAAGRDVDDRLVGVAERDVRCLGEHAAPTIDVARSHIGQRDANDLLARHALDGRRADILEGGDLLVRFFHDSHS